MLQLLQLATIYILDVFVQLSVLNDIEELHNETTI